MPCRMTPFSKTSSLRPGCLANASDPHAQTRESAMSATDPLSAPPADAYAILEQLVCDLPLCEDLAEKVRLVLEAVRAGTGADVVYWYPGSSRAALQAVGSRRLAPEWCREMVRQQT